MLHCLTRALAVAIVSSGSLLACGAASAQSESPVLAKEPWTYSITIDGYFSHNETSYLDPIVTADRDWLHLEARYNYENLQTGSLWAGYNFSAGRNLVLHVTPMIGVVFGKTNGIAPGSEVSLTYKRLELSISNEYVFDRTDKSGNFYYSWLELTYSPADWFRVGIVSQHTKAFHAALDVQPGILVGVSHKQWEFTAYVFNASFAAPTLVLEAGVNL
jgi:hypothetical protein